MAEAAWLSGCSGSPRVAGCVSTTLERKVESLDCSADSSSKGVDNTSFALGFCLDGKNVIESDGVPSTFTSNQNFVSAVLLYTDIRYYYIYRQIHIKETNER